MELQMLDTIRYEIVIPKVHVFLNRLLAAIEVIYNKNIGDMQHIYIYIYIYIIAQQIHQTCKPLGCSFRL